MQTQERALRELRLPERGKSICLVKRGEDWFAIAPKCPHQGGPLAGGSFNEQGELICPWHRFAFDLLSGQAVSGGYHVQTYPLEWRGEELWVDLPRKKWWQLG
jgi:3-phenylpropionate/trans-cinnamate dioxygenase ferredoxin subunit